MPVKKHLVYIALLAATLQLAGQMNKADRYFAHGEFIKAIPIYKKETRSKNPDVRQEAQVKLAHSYRLLSQYAQAEQAYRAAVESGQDVPADVYYQYAQVLRANMKYEEAAAQYSNYIKLSPNDQNAVNAYKFCLEIKYYLTKPIEYEVKNMTAVNSSKSEFSPFVMDGRLMFIAERQSFDFVNYNTNSSNGEPYLNMFVSEITGGELKKSKPFSKNINTEYHDGPACLSADGKTLYFTRVSNMQKNNSVNQSKIYTAVGSKSTWKQIKPLEFNNDEYSYAHPSISEDSNRLYFTSNMPGGFGGKDIWMCERKNVNESWGEPFNLGPDINTTGDEMFPTIRKDGRLYFSSNGLPGFGGLDIYSAREVDGKWVLNRNEGLNLNSSADDFGITFLNDSMGYFSSNRAGGLGSDDIYLYTYNNKSAEVSGNVLLTENLKDPAKNKKVLLLDENGNVLDSTYTDDQGHFSFKNLNADRKYMASIEETDPVLAGKARYYLAENDSVIHRVTGKYRDNKFVFKNLPVDPNDLPDMYTNDDLVFAGTLRYGPDGTPLKNATIKIVNDFGDVVEETTTNEFGAFAFRNIPSDQNYLVALDEGEATLAEGTKIVMTNKAGKEVKTFYKQGGKFTFQVLNADKKLLEEMDAEDVNLTMDLFGYMYDQDKKPLANAKVKVSDEDGGNPQEWLTTVTGRFKFTNLDADKNYIFEVDENDPSMKGVRRIYIADNKGRVYKIVDLLAGKFSFKIVEVDKHSLGEFVVDDPWLKVADIKRKEEAKKAVAANNKANKNTKEKSLPAEKKEPEPEAEPEVESEINITIVENIYYGYGDYELGPEGKAVLDKAVEALTENPRLIMEINAHTCSISSAEFNMGLSIRRANTAVDYLVSKGISRSRLKAKGWGETKLLNHCADGVECTEEQHKINRRTEFKITKPTKT